MIVDPARAITHPEGEGVTTCHLSDAGGLVQFGAYLQVLAPGSVTSHRHWHSAEDEFLLVLDGTVVAVDDDGAHPLGAGDAACWRHGEPNGHHVKNLSDAPARFLIVGSRAARDVCHYPDGNWKQVNHDTTWELLDDTGARRDGGDLPPELLGLRSAWGKPWDGVRTPRYFAMGTVQGETGAAGGEHGLPALGAYVAHPISDAGGLTQFGAFTETLMPGAQSSHRHWHAQEDEFLYVLEGEVTIIENDGPHRLGPGGCACWPAGVANAHCLRNDTETPVTYFVAGSRLPEDEVTYPDIDLHYRRAAGWRHVTRKDGTPLPGWPKETNR